MIRRKRDATCERERGGEKTETETKQRGSEKMKIERRQEKANRG